MLVGSAYLLAYLLLTINISFLSSASAHITLTLYEMHTFLKSLGELLWPVSARVTRHFAQEVTAAIANERGRRVLHS